LRRWPAKRVLDVGCGGGILADAMARKGADVLGIDLSSKSLKVAQLHALEPRRPVRRLPRGQCRGAGGGAGRQLRRGDLHGNAGARARPGVGRAACATLVKPGGWVFFSTINRNPKSFLFAIVGAEYVLNCCRAAPTNTPR
jgi:2-polyprenyl-6-hydroxyphenyl methylase/3-demethylubiquinone-9 3-methyltransferase